MLLNLITRELSAYSVDCTTPLHRDVGQDSGNLQTVTEWLQATSSPITLSNIHLLLSNIDLHGHSPLQLTYLSKRLHSTQEGSLSLSL